MAQKEKLLGEGKKLGGATDQKYCSGSKNNSRE